MPRALLSVSDKTGLEFFAQQLLDAGYDLISTGGTFRALQAAGLDVQQVSEVTGSPEILGGRVKTLHPKIHGGILAKRDEEHLAELEAQGITPIDIVVVNLYPFRETVAQEVSLDIALENIDIGGPTMLRAAAKNFPHVLVVSDPADYARVVEVLQAGVGGGLRSELARKAFAHTAAYDAAIVHYLSQKSDNEWPDETTLELHKVRELRYGENPHQRASLWRFGSERGPVLDAKVLHGKAMSFNNYGDAEAAWNLLSELPKSAAVAVKHANPCGVALADDLSSAYKRAHAADPVSIFGGVVAVNETVTEALAEELAKTFLEIILAPSYESAALERLQRKKNVRLLEVTSSSISFHQRDIRSLRGGLLVQDMDGGTLDDADLRVVTERQPTANEWRDLRFAWTVCKHVKSNAIVLAKAGVTTGIGAGQVSRIWAAEGAVERAGEAVTDCVMASDAFFPFDDVVKMAAGAGVKAVIQPGGSVRDEEVIAAADELGLAMVFTGMRHFKH